MGRITSLDLLATLLLMQPRVLLPFWAARTHCWVILSFPPTSTPQGCSQSILHPACISAWDCASPCAGSCTWPCWTSCGLHRLIDLSVFAKIAAVPQAGTGVVPSNTILDVDFLESEGKEKEVPLSNRIVCCRWMELKPLRLKVKWTAFPQFRSVLLSSNLPKHRHDGQFL